IADGFVEPAFFQEGFMLRVTHIGQMAMKNLTQISASRIHGYPCLEVGRPPPRYSAMEASRSCCCRWRCRESASAESLPEPEAFTYSRARVGSGLRRRVNRTRIHCSSVLVEGVDLGVWMTFEREIG